MPHLSDVLQGIALAFRQQCSHNDLQGITIYIQNSIAWPTKKVLQASRHGWQHGDQWWMGVTGRQAQVPGHQGTSQSRQCMAFEAVYAIDGS
jgi:hypothetical protein